MPVDWSDEAAEVELANATWQTLENRDFGNPTIRKTLPGIRISLTATRLI
jgi:hypothetical protein